MKKITKGIIMTLALMILSVSIASAAAGAKSIYFAGEYKGSKGKVSLGQYSSPEETAYGLNVGTAKFYGFKNKKKNQDISIYKKKANRYESLDGFITIIVKKKSIVVKGGILDWDSGKTLSLKGKYKLKKRYPKP